MRAVTVVAVAVVLAALAGIAVVGVTGGFGASGSDVALSVTWTSDTAVPSENNHHEVAVGVVDDDHRVFAPVSSTGSADACALVALDASDGTTTWRDPVPSANCTIHAVADPALADYDDDGTTELLATTTERVLNAYTADGDVERSWSLSAYGYTRPIVADLTDDGASEIVVVDSSGRVHVLRTDGTNPGADDVAWTADHDAYVWATPVVADVDADGAREVVVADGAGTVTAYAADGETDWTLTLGDAAVTWASAATGEDGVVDLYYGTPGGDVVAVSGTGEREWTRSLPDLTAPGAVVRDDEGTGVVVTASDGTARRLDAETGETVWETAVTADAVQMMPPPVAGDVDGDDAAELVVAGNDGTVALLDPTDGSTLATNTRDATVYAAPVLEDVDDDDKAEVFVIYGDGTARRFDVDDE